MIVGIDAGKYQTKIVCDKGCINFPSKLAAYRELMVNNENDNFTIEYNGQKYFGGDLAEREGYIGISYKDESKLHYTTLINVLISLYLVGGNDYKIVVGSPISRRSESEKKQMKEMIKGEHTITINGEEQRINIAECEVSPEGAAGFYSQPEKGFVQGLDCGSTTVNYFYMSDKKFVDKQSGTFPFEDGRVNIEAFLREMETQLANKFKKGNRTMLLGGNAKEFFPYVRECFPEAFIVQNPVFATSIGFYKIARGIYGKDDC
jgi:plasmid segregation protein ParM